MAAGLLVNPPSSIFLLPTRSKSPAWNLMTPESLDHSR